MVYNHIGFTSSTGGKPQLLHSITTTNTSGALKLPRRSLVLAPPVSCFQPSNRRVPAGAGAGVATSV